MSDFNEIMPKAAAQVGGDVEFRGLMSNQPELRAE